MSTEQTAESTQGPATTAPTAPTGLLTTYPPTAERIRDVLERSTTHRSGNLRYDAELRAWLSANIEDLLAAREDRARLAAIREHCHVVYFPHNRTAYPIEHNLLARKDQFDAILYTIASDDAARSAARPSAPRSGD